MSASAVVEEYLLDVLGGSKQVSAEAVVASEDLRRRTEILIDAFPDLDVDVVVLVAEGDLVAAHFRARGTHRGLFQGAPPTGRPCEMRCTGIYRVESGRITEAYVTWDTLSLMEQLGAVERAAAVSA